MAENSTLKLLALYDENPKLIDGWQHKVFIRNVNPIDESTPLLDLGKYISLKINPSDNKENLTTDYLSMLESMPELWRRRFLKEIIRMI